MKKMTEANLMAAFAGESQAHMKYLNFAEKARRENLPNIARLFEAVPLLLMITMVLFIIIQMTGDPLAAYTVDSTLTGADIARIGAFLPEGARVAPASEQASWEMPSIRQPSPSSTYV